MPDPSHHWSAYAQSLEAQWRLLAAKLDEKLKSGTEFRDGVEEAIRLTRERAQQQIKE